MAIDSCNKMGQLSDKELSSILIIQQTVSVWFQSSGRKFPWREYGVPVFRKILTEILVQRTKAQKVASIYGSFFDRFSGWESLDMASIEEIQEYLKPLGIWRRRAITLKNLSHEMVKRNGVFPADRLELDTLPGVGQYVGNAVELFVYSRALPLLDTNMARVMERVFRPRILADIRYDPWLQKICKEVVSCKNPVEVNWALLDIGGTVCKPKNPTCRQCPLESNCSWNLRHS